MIPAVRISAVCIVISLCSACSLQYTSQENTENTIPEFTFDNASFTRIKDSRQIMEMKAVKLEQYKNDNSVFARGISFKTYSSSGSVDTEGTCSYLAADTDTEQYSFFNNIDIRNYRRNMEILAESLHWNGKNEQLTGGINSTLTIKRKDTSLTGMGFSASAVSGRFVFDGHVTGTVASAVSPANTGSGAEKQ